MYVYMHMFPYTVVFKYQYETISVLYFYIKVTSLKLFSKLCIYMF